MDLKIEKKNIKQLNNYFKVLIIFLSISLHMSVYAKCLYESEFFDKTNTIHNYTLLDGNIINFNETKDDSEEFCFIKTTMNDKVIDIFPKKNEQVYKCNYINAQREKSFVLKVDYNALTKKLGIIIAHEFSITLATGGISSFYTKELLIYEYKNGSLNKIKNNHDTKYIAWGDGYIQGNQVNDSQNLICDDNSKMLYNLDYIDHLLNLKMISLTKQSLYSSPNIKTKMYLVKGDKVEILEEKDDWIKILYKGKKDITAWIPKNSLE